MLRFPVLLLGVFSLGTLAVPLSLPPAGKASKRIYMAMAGAGNNVNNGNVNGPNAGNTVPGEMLDDVAEQQQAVNNAGNPVNSGNSGNGFAMGMGSSSLFPLVPYMSIGSANSGGNMLVTMATMNPGSLGNTGMSSGGYGSKRGSGPGAFTSLPSNSLNFGRGFEQGSSLPMMSKSAFNGISNANSVTNTNALLNTLNMNANAVTGSGLANNMNAVLLNAASNMNGIVNNAAMNSANLNAAFEMNNAVNNAIMNAAINSANMNAAASMNAATNNFVLQSSANTANNANANNVNTNANFNNANDATLMAVLDAGNQNVGNALNNAKNLNNNNAKNNNGLNMNVVSTAMNVVPRSQSLSAGPGNVGAVMVVPLMPDTSQFGSSVPAMATGNTELISVPAGGVTSGTGSSQLVPGGNGPQGSSGMTQVAPDCYVDQAGNIVTVQQQTTQDSSTGIMSSASVGKY